MALFAASIMIGAGRILNDEDAVRWTLPEIADWIREAVKAIILAKPSANSVSVVLSLVQGTAQTIGPGNLALLRVTRNITSEGPPRIGGRIVRPVPRDALDAQQPYWHDPNKVPYKAEVRQFVYDEEDPLSWYCYPGNDGTGKVEALVSQLPTDFSADDGKTGTEAYESADIGLAETYFSPILDYVLWRALSKDDEGGSPAGAIAHYQSFASAVGVKIQTEGSNSPNSRPGIVGT